MDRGAWQAEVVWVAQLDMTEALTTAGCLGKKELLSGLVF